MPLTSAAKEVAGGTAAAVVGTLLGHPLDTVKVHLQADGGAKLKSTADAARALLAGAAPRNNPAVFYRGVLPPLGNAVVMNSVMFSVFGAVKAAVPDSPAGSLAAGLISGFATACISTPTDFVKIQAQLHGARTLAVLRQVCRRHPCLLYQGHTANLAREGLFTMVYLGLYDRAAGLGTRRSGADGDGGTSLGYAAAVSSATGAAAWVVTYPFDTMKTLMQRGGTETRASFARAFAEVAGRGVGGAYRGCAASTVRAMLVTSSRMVVFEWVVRAM